MAFTLSLISQSVLAHSKIKSTQPADNQIVSLAPKKLVLNFNQAVRLIKIKVSDHKGKEVSLTYKANSTASDVFQIPLPQLAPSEYLVSWTIMGADSHIIKGKFSFTYKPDTKQQ